MIFAEVRRPARLVVGLVLSISLPVVAASAGPAYMDDTNTRAPTPDSSVTTLNDGFPRILAHEYGGEQSDVEYSKYMLIAAKGRTYPSIENIQNNLSPGTTMVRHISGRAYQSWNYQRCYISGGVAFEKTTPASEGGPKASGCGIYAGHWLYRPGTKLRDAAGADARVLSVQKASRIESGQYVVIYDAPAGSFKNAEHALVTAVDRGTNTITVKRGFKSTPRAREGGAIVAQHVLGQGTDPQLWAFNQSSQSPRDANGKTFGEFYAEWLGRNLLRYQDGKMTSADVAGVLFDADFYYHLKAYKADVNNDLKLDNGISPTGRNWLGEGLEDFYRRVRAELPGKYVLTGHQHARGYDATHGGQLESWVDYGNKDFSPKPTYTRVNEMFARYLYEMAERTDGPPLVQTLTKTPTKQYPGKAGSAAKSNAPFRLALTMALMEDGYFGTHSEVVGHAWWDEYAVFTDPDAANFGHAVPTKKASAIRRNRGWLGQPIGNFERVYDETLFEANKNMLANGTFEQNIKGWRAKNVSISRDTDRSMDGDGSMSVSGMIDYIPEYSGARVKSERVPVIGGEAYTVAVSLRSNAHREIRVSLGNDSARLPVAPRWRRYVVTLRPTRSAETALNFAVGKENDPLWIDSVYLFNGEANVFKREFDRGLAIANATPKRQRVVVGPGYRRIAGNQDPAINNGEEVTAVNVPPYDGLLLVKTGESGTGGGGASGDGRIGDFVWRDQDGNGRQDPGEPGWAGIKVDLLTCGGDYIATTSSASDGSYAFDQLGAGRYRIAVEAPSDATLSPLAGGGADTSDVDPETGQSWCAEITAAGERFRSLDVGLIPAASGTGRIGDFVWHDLNGDGIQNDSEPGLSGVEVRLRGCNGVFKSTTTSGANGAYAFSKLPLEKFLIEFVLPPGAEFSPAERGTSGGKDSNADPVTGFTSCVNLEKNATRPGLDAGIRL